MPQRRTSTPKLILFNLKRLNPFWRHVMEKDV